MLLLCLFLPLLSIVDSAKSTANEQHAIVHARLEKSLFELASTTAKQIVGDEVPKIPLPSIDEKFAGIRMRSRWVRWNGFEAPKTNFTISESGLGWETSGGMAKIKIHFEAKWLFFTSICTTGFADFTALDLMTSLQATLHNQKSRPQIGIKICASNVGRVRVEVQGIFGFFINKFFHMSIENTLSDTISTETCKMVSRLVAQGNKFVMAQPEEIPIWNAIALNYTVIGEPSFRNDAIEATSAFRLAVGNFTVADDEEEGDDDLIESPRDQDHAIHATFPTAHFNISMQDALFYSAAFIGALNLIVKFKNWE